MASGGLEAYFVKCFVITFAELALRPFHANYCVTRNLSVDLCYESADWFHCQRALGFGWVGAYSVEWFAKHFTEQTLDLFDVDDSLSWKLVGWFALRLIDWSYVIGQLK